MIRVDNHPNKRIFTTVDLSLDKHKEIKGFVDEVIKKIEEIEKEDIDKRDYSPLKNFEKDPKAINLSLYFFKSKIDDAIKPLEDAFKKPIQDNIYKILVGDIQLIREFNKHYRVLSDKDRKGFNAYKEVFENLYKTNLSSKSDWKRAFFKLFSDMNVCPYCNRNFINPIYKKTTTQKGDNQTQSPDIEHFFPKSKYPYLSLSISNLLPSCNFCNKIKSDVTISEKFKSPYEIKESEISFKFEPIDNQRRLIRVESDLDNVKVLNLDDLYHEVHSEYVNDIFLSVNKNPLEHRRYLEKFFSLSQDTQEHIYKKKFCNYYKNEDFNKQPLSKMTKELFLHIKENEKK